MSKEALSPCSFSNVSRTKEQFGIDLSLTQERDYREIEQVEHRRRKFWYYYWVPPGISKNVIRQEMQDKLQREWDKRVLSLSWRFLDLVCFAKAPVKRCQKHSGHSVFVRARKSSQLGGTLSSRRNQIVSNTL